MRTLTKAFLILIIAINFIIVLVGCNPERNEHYKREITTADVIVEKFSNSLYFSFIVRPQIDIEDLMITIGFYDKNDYPVGCRTKKLGSVKKGQEYHIQFTTSDFTTKEYLAISKYKYINADATIWIEQETHGICFEHTYNDGYITKKPSCYHLGEKTYTCTKCGYKRTECIATTEHNWISDIYTDSDKICSICCIRWGN